jgi:LCP family protein required for cell wall assembly
MNRKRKWILIAGIFFLLLVMGALGYAYYLYNSLTKAVDTAYEPTERAKSEKRAEKVILKDTEPFSVLMLGVDERKGDKGRSDTMIVLTVNPKKNSVKMLSIPRDTRTDIIGHGRADKMNHAYAFGGVEMSVATVENYLDIPLDYYIKMNMAGFADIVDALGGITVTNDLDFQQGSHHFAKGNIHLNGKQALAFVRMRKNDPNGDFGRQGRQREVIQGVIDKGGSIRSVTSLDNVFEEISHNVKTDLTFTEMIHIKNNYKGVQKNVDQLSLKGSGQYIGEIWYLIVPEEERLRVQKELKEHLELNQ